MVLVTGYTAEEIVVEGVLVTAYADEDFGSSTGVGDWLPRWAEL